MTSTLELVTSTNDYMLSLCDDLTMATSFDNLHHFLTYTNPKLDVSSHNIIQLHGCVLFYI